MKACVLILTDAPARPLEPRAGEDWPRLPALEFLLARARVSAHGAGDWRRWLLAAQGAGAAPSSLADLAAGVLGDAGSGHWLATPVHWVAGLDTVRLHPRGLLTLNAAHAALLAEDFARVFAGSGWQLRATAGRELLLAGPSGLRADSDDPELWLGESPRPGLPRGAGAMALRRLGSEIEMWLHEHAVNRERQRAGDWPVSALWLWGGAAATPTVAAQPTAPPPTASLPGTLRSDDLVARALWDAAAPASVPEAEYVTTTLRQIEADWLATRLADWRAGRLQALGVLAGAQLYMLRGAARWRFWVRTRPWWETLSP